MADSLIRFGVFIVVFSLMLVWEQKRPFRKFAQSKTRHALINLGMMLTNFALLRLLAGGGAFYAAYFAQQQQFGLFNIADVSAWIALPVCLLILDFAIYWQHRIFHIVPVFWRIHRVHHTDLGFDTTTAVRFHPIEIVLSMYYKMALVLLLGIAPEAVVVFEVLLNACALFNHGNVCLPDSWEPWVRRLLITPDMHRIHHSTFSEETNSNYGFSVPWWDRLCQTYTESPRLGQKRMSIGLSEERDPHRLLFKRLLLLPLEK